MDNGSPSTLADDLVAHPDLIPLLDLEGDEGCLFRLGQSYLRVRFGDPQ